MLKNSNNFKIKNTLRFALLFFALSFTLYAPLAQAAIIEPCNAVPVVGEEANTCGVKHIFLTLVNVYNFLLGMAAIVAMLFLIWGGVKMLIYQFDEQPEQFLQGAKHTVSRAITGLIIVAIAYLIVYTLLTVLGLGDDKIQEYLQGTIFN